MSMKIILSKAIDPKVMQFIQNNASYNEMQVLYTAKISKVQNIA